MKKMQFLNSPEEYQSEFLHDEIFIAYHTEKIEKRYKALVKQIEIDEQEKLQKGLWGAFKTVKFKLTNAHHMHKKQKQFLEKTLQSLNSERQKLETRSNQRNYENYLTRSKAIISKGFATTDDIAVHSVNPVFVKSYLENQGVSLAVLKHYDKSLFRNLSSVIQQQEKILKEKRSPLKVSSKKISGLIKAQSLVLMGGIYGVSAVMMDNLALSASYATAVTVGTCVLKELFDSYFNAKHYTVDMPNTMFERDILIGQKLKTIDSYKDIFMSINGASERQLNDAYNSIHEGKVLSDNEMYCMEENNLLHLFEQILPQIRKDYSKEHGIESIIDSVKPSKNKGYRASYKQGVSSIGTKSYGLNHRAIKSIKERGYISSQKPSFSSS